MKYPEIEEDRRKMTAKSFSLAAKKRWKECEERKDEFLSAKWLSNHFDFSESPRYGYGPSGLFFRHFSGKSVKKLAEILS